MEKWDLNYRNVWTEFEKNFSANHILREIKFGKNQTLKKCYFGNFRGSGNLQNPQKTNFRGAKTVKVANLQKLIWRKIWVEDKLPYFHIVGEKFQFSSHEKLREINIFSFTTMKNDFTKYSIK